MTMIKWVVSAFLLFPFPPCFFLAENVDTCFLFLFLIWIVEYILFRLYLNDYSPSFLVDVMICWCKLEPNEFSYLVYKVHMQRRIVFLFIH